MDAQRILRLHNPIKSYAWGSQTAIPELLGVPWMVYPLVALGLLITFGLPRLSRAVPPPLGPQTCFGSPTCFAN